MPRGARFTADEDTMITTIFSEGARHARYRYDWIKEYIESHQDLNIPSLRGYSAYVSRWRTIRERDNLGRYGDAPTTQAPSTVAPTRPPERKRKVDQMSEAELDKYEEKVLARIKKRREEIDMEKTRIPECPVCMDDTENPVIASCGHVFCVQCYCKLLSRDLPTYSQRCHTCPTCRAEWNRPNKVVFMDFRSTIADCKEKGATLSV